MSWRPCDPTALRRATSCAGLRQPESADAPCTLKSQVELSGMRRAGAALGRALRTAADLCAAGITTLEVADHVRREIARAGAAPLFEGLRQGDSPPFSHVACVSVNDEVVHAPPGPRVLCAGDLVTIDAGLMLDGWCADSALCVVVGGAGRDERAQAATRLADAVKSALESAAGQMKPGVRWSEIAQSLEHAAASHAFGIVHEYVGHGIGRALHEAPRAPAFWHGFDGPDFVLRDGMTLAVEPIFTCDPNQPSAPQAPHGSALQARRTRVLLQPDGWTVVTADGSLAAHAEHVIAVTPAGGLVLTLPD